MTLSQQADNDLNAFFDITTGFAITAAATIGGVNSSIPVILDSPFAISDVLARAENATLHVHARKSQVLNAKRGDKLVINAVTFWIIGTPEDTGDGRVCRLALSKDQI